MQGVSLLPYVQGQLPGYGYRRRLAPSYRALQRLVPALRGNGERHACSGRKASVSVDTPSRARGGTSALLGTRRRGQLARCRSPAWCNELAVKGLALARLSSLADSIRVAWVSDAARAIWQPRIEQIQQTLLWTELDAIANGNLTAALVDCPRAEVDAFFHKLSALALAAIPTGAHATSEHSVEIAQLEPAVALTHHLFVCRPAVLEAAVERFLAEDATDRRILLGYPPCCAHAAEARRNPVGDPLFAWVKQAAANAGPCVHLDGPIEANVLALPMGVAAVNYAPCSPACVKTVARGRERLSRGRGIGYGVEMDWLTEVLAWPGKYSATNGLAEVTLPVLKFVMATERSAVPLRADRPGALWPEAGRRGVLFTNHPAASAARDPAGDPESMVTASYEAPFADGEARIEEFARRGRFAHLVWAHARLIRSVTGPLLNLGCEDGLLLEFAHLEGRRSIPWGIDEDEASIEVARHRHSGHGGLFVASTNYTRAVEGTLKSNGRPRLVLLNLGKFRNLRPDDQATLRNTLRALAATLIVYSDDRTARDQGGFAAALAALGFETGDVVPTWALSALARPVQ